MARTPSVSRLTDGELNEPAVPGHRDETACRWHQRRPDHSFSTRAAPSAPEPPLQHQSRSFRTIDALVRLRRPRTTLEPEICLTLLLFDV